MKKPNDSHDNRMRGVPRFVKFGMLVVLIMIALVCHGQPVSASDTKNIEGDVQASKAIMLLGKENPTFGDNTQNDKAIREAAKYGDKDAQFSMGLEYVLGDEQDSVQAIAWFRKAAEQGHPTAQYFLGLGYKEGDGVETDPDKAARWFQKSAEQGFEYAQLEIGLCYAIGTGVEKDIVQAAVWLRKAAEQGNADAQYYLATCYANGDGVEKDLSQAVYWWHKAAEQGGISAQYNLAICYQDGDGVEKDLNQAVSWYCKAAEQGMKEAQRELGNCYYDGKGVKKDQAQAVYWWRKAAEQGMADSQYNLGVAYAKGHGVRKDRAQAIHWFRKAANQGDSAAQYNLGICYRDGTGVVQDDRQACVHFLIAGALGDTDAAGEIKRMRDNRLSAKEYMLAKQQANEWMKEYCNESCEDEVEEPKLPSDVQQNEFIASGSGFLITSNGYFLTCAHVVEDSGVIKVDLDSITYAAKLICIDPQNDIALLRLNGDNFRPLAFAPNLPQMGERVFTLGYPNPDIQGSAAKYTDGVVSSLTGIMDDVRTMQITVPVQGGNSGGPLVDAAGNVSGLVVAQLNAATVFEYTGDIPQNVNFAVKINYALPLVQSIPDAVQNLPQPQTMADRDFIESVKAATGLVLVYE